MAGGSRVVLSLGGDDPHRLARALADAPAVCDLLELRADRLSAESVRGLVAGVERSLIVTVRRRSDGGSFRGGEADRRSLLAAALEAGAAFVDVEFGCDLAAGLIASDASRVILSHHGGRCDGEELRALWRRMAATGAARVKLVPQARAAGDNAALRDLLGSVAGERPPTIAFASGRYGRLSRIMATAWGSAATYAAAAGMAETAEGQLTADELLDVYGVDRLTAATRIYALVGAAVRTSPSPRIQNPALRSRGLDAVYVALDALNPADALGLLDGPSAFAGFGVTMPFKEAFALRCAPGDPIARAAASVNTVRRADAGWQGHNTDGSAAVALAARWIEPSGSRVRVLGAGGTGAAVAAAFAARGARVTLYNRDASRARRVAERLGVASAPWDERERDGWELLVQATPLGKAGEIVYRGPWSGAAVLDVVYGDRPTPLVASARAAGLQAADGMAFLREQARRQFEILTGTDWPADVGG